MTLLYHWSNPKFKGKPWPAEKQPKKKKNRKHKRRNHAKNRFIHPYESRCRSYLKDFWDIFNSGKLNRMNLVHMASDPGWARIDKGLLRRLRKDFNKQRWQYLEGIGPECAICCADRWIEKHHVIPLCFGGINDNLNLMGICLNCHNEIHPWMKVVK
jgi:hypothetical protein